MKPPGQLPSPGIMAVAGVCCAALFLAFPGLDLLTSGWLYTPARSFILDGNPLTDFVHEHLGWVAFGVALLIWLANRIMKGKMATGLWRKQAAYILLVLIVGPGLLVNVVFKDHWGRARPVQVENFGGPARFTPAWIPSNQCDTNCSFVCGDSSVGFSLLALAFLSRRPRRWFLAAIGAGSAIGLMRMAQGGHFFSDVVFSFFAVYFAAWLLHQLLFPTLGTENRSSSPD
ncbi:MAG: phosphatase PAP2 family protein [Parasulfuritortus sp.]|nr:phosphatase PAP2 family protein [Parasulfuritortus sp.]